MERFKKDIAPFEDDYDLTFTKDDRIKTLKKIRENQNRKKKLKDDSHNKLHIGPIFATVTVFVMALVFLLPNLSDELTQEKNNLLQASQQETYSFSALLMEKETSEFDNNRADIYILLTYNSKDHSIKLVPIPRDTYTQIFDLDGNVIAEDKLMYASIINSTPEPVLETVSHLFDIPIDYYSIIPLEEIYEELFISQSDLKDKSMVYDLGRIMKEHLTSSKLIKFLEGSETNIPDELSSQMKASNINSIEVIEMDKGFEGFRKNGKYYLKIDQKILDETSDNLKQHLDGGK